MQVRVLTLRFDPRLEGFDDTALRALCRDAEVLSVRDQFFVRDEVPYWSVMVTYNVPPGAGDVPAPQRQEGAQRQGYRATLREEDWPLFNSLRDWRAARASKEGVPPFLVLTNDVLALVARQRPTTLNALGQIRGLGEAKVKRFGRELLGILGSPGAAVSATEGGEQPQAQEPADGAAPSEAEAPTATEPAAAGPEAEGSAP